MKKGIKNLAIATMVGVASMGLMTGCGKQDSKPYIQVSGLDTGYIVGEEINLDGAKILYFSDKNDTTADEIKLTESMVANFNTDIAGNKIMKVLWNGFALEINYSVISENDFIDLYNNAYDNFINSTDVHAQMRVVSGDVVQVGGAEVSNNKYYDFAVIAGEEIELQHWIEKYNNIWYVHEIEEDGCFRNECDMIVNDNIMEYAFESVLMMENEELSAAAFSELKDVKFDIDDDKTILSFKLDGGEEGLQETVLTIENGMFTKVETNFYNDDGESVDYTFSVTISYNAEDVHRVELPTDVEWIDSSL